jgi:hypothetical protein
VNIRINVFDIVGYCTSYMAALLLVLTQVT